MFSSVQELRTPSTILPAICTVLCLANELKFFSMTNSVEEMRSLQLFTKQSKNQGSRSSFSQKDTPILNDPLGVKNQTGTFADAFKEHEYRCEKKLVQRWRSALTEATYLSGYHLTVIKLESQLINKIVEDILERLNDHMSLNLLENSHTIDIGEQESGDKDKEAIQKALIKKSKREMIDEKMNAIIDLVPGANKDSRKVMVLDEISNYIKALQRQVEFLSMKLVTTANSSLTPSIEVYPSKYITTERIFVATNFKLEVPSAIFEQLSSKHKPQYELVSMLMSFTAMLICIMELVYKGGEGRVRWKWKEKIPWFYYSNSNQEPFGTVTDFIGLICANFQCIFASVDYAFYLRNNNVPIKVSVWPLVFAFCLLCSKLSKYPHNKML